MASAGMRVGLLGGSFNPAHDGHRHISLEVMKRLELDRVWWIVSPGNPLKSRHDLASLDMRLHMASAKADHVRIEVTGFEAALGSSFTARTLAYLKVRYSNVHFAWMMGADNLVQFDRWHDWHRIAATLPIVVADRPNWRYRALASKAAIALARARIPARFAAGLATMPAPCWTYLDIPLSQTSSSALRLAGLHGNSSA